MFLSQYTGPSGESEWVAFASALMENKGAADYRDVFRSLQRQWAKLGLQPVFQKLQTDFEQGEMRAVADVFGGSKANFI